MLRETLIASVEQRGIVTSSVVPGAPTASKSHKKLQTKKDKTREEGISFEENSDFHNPAGT